MGMFPSPMGIEVGLIDNGRYIRITYKFPSPMGIEVGLIVIEDYGGLY